MTDKSKLEKILPYRSERSKKETEAHKEQIKKNRETFTLKR
jgi:hypothetical protein